MDPLPIAYGCALLVAEVTSLNSRIPIFISNVRLARKDLDGLHRELSSLELCVNALKDDDQAGHLTYSPSLKQQINHILNSTATVVRDINRAIVKLSSRNIDHGFSWSPTDRLDMVHFRSVLESNRLALDLAVTLSTIAKLLDQRQTLLDRRDALHRLAEGTATLPTITLIRQSSLDTASEALQLDCLKQEIGDLRSQLSDLSAPNLHETMQQFSHEARAYTKSLLEPFPILHTEFVSQKLESSLSPSTSVSTATSSSAFTMVSVSCSATSADSRLEQGKCPACARRLVTEIQETAVQIFHDKQISARAAWQRKLETEQEDFKDEIARLQKSNSALESGRQQDLDNKIEEVIKEKDSQIEELRAQFRATSFFASVRTKGLDNTITSARNEFAAWERVASTMSMGRMMGDATMSTGAPDEDGSDTTATEQPMRILGRPMNSGLLPGITDVSPSDSVEKIIFEFSTNYVREDLMLKGLSGAHRCLSSPVMIRDYKKWATVDAIVRQILNATTEQSPPLMLELNTDPYYLTKVTRRYDAASDRPIVEVQPLASNQSVANLRILSGDKLRLMQGPLGFHLSTDRNHNLHHYSPLNRVANGLRQPPIPHSGRAMVATFDESLPEVLTPARSPNVSPRYSQPPQGRPPSIISSHIRSDSGSSYPQPDIIVSRPEAPSEYSGYSASRRGSQPLGTLTATPLFEFRVDRSTGSLKLKPRSLFTNHSNYYSRLGPASSVHHEAMISIYRQVHSDPVHFTDSDATLNMKNYVTGLLQDLLACWNYDARRIFLQVRSTLMHNTEALREYGISDNSSIWVMLKPYKPSDRLSLGFSSAETIPADNELWVEQPDIGALQRLSFNDQNFRRVYQARKNTRSATASVRS